MKYILFILIAIVSVSCTSKRPSSSEALDNKTEFYGTNKISTSFDWLIGHWRRVNNDSEKETFEIWKRESNSRYLGHGFIMKELDTLWQERMMLIKQDSVWVFKVKTPGNSDLVTFKLTHSDTNAFTVENPIHDFPNKINYWKSKGRLLARVSGVKDELYYEFERIN